MFHVPSCIYYHMLNISYYRGLGIVITVRLPFLIFIKVVVVPKSFKKLTERLQTDINIVQVNTFL